MSIQQEVNWVFDNSGNLLGYYPPNQGNFVSLATVLALNLPTTLPSKSGVLWNNGGVLSIS